MHVAVTASQPGMVKTTETSRFFYSQYSDPGRDKVDSTRQKGEQTASVASKTDDFSINRTATFEGTKKIIP